MKTITCDHELITLTRESIQIETLKLHATGISFQALQSLSHLSNLKELYISIGRLTEDLIMIILSLTKLHTLGISCGRLMPGAFQKLYLISSLCDFHFFCKLKPEILDLEPLSFIVQLTSLAIWNISEEKLFFISSLLNLVSLELDCNVTDVLCFKLSALKKLKKLKLKGTDSGLECLSSFRHLEVLDLSGSSEITEKTLAYILEMYNLITLNLSGCNNIRDAYCFDAIDRYSDRLFKNLVDLNLSGCSALTGEFLSAIGENSRIKTLNLKKCHNILDGAFNSFKDLGNLIYADLTGCSLLENFSFLEQSKQLDVLYLERCNGVNDVTFQSLRELPALTNLSIAHCHNLSDEGIKYLNHLIGLKALCLSGCNVTADALIQLRLLNQLTILDLSCCRSLTEIDIKIISAFPSLTDLRLNHCEQLSIKELRHLKNLRTLKKLWLDDCFDIPEDKLQKILPNVDIWI